MPLTGFELARRSIVAIRDDLQRHFVHVEPCEANFYSYGTYSESLLVRNGIEFEQICRSTIHALRPGVRFENVKDWSVLYDVLELGTLEFRFCYPPGERSKIEPFVNWTDEPHGLWWFRCYNGLKHDRAAQISNANLHAVLSAYVANVSLMALCGQIIVDPSNHIHRENQRVEWIVDGFHVGIVKGPKPIENALGVFSQL
jgi:hypothetical protein